MTYELSKSISVKKFSHVKIKDMLYYLNSIQNTYAKQAYRTFLFGGPHLNISMPKIGH